MPAALEQLEKDGAATRWDAAAIAALPEVVGLKFFQGAAVDHLVEVEFAGTCAGFAPMFWIDLLVFTFALFYVDIVLDVRQLVLFANSRLHGYLILNLAGMTLPPMFTTIEAMRFCAHGSPEKDRLERLLSPTLLLPAILTAVITQTLMAVLVTLSALARRKHPLLAGAKIAEVAESAVSALVQTNFLISALGGIEQIRALELSEDQLQSLALSVAVSCFSLGLGFAGRDKADSAVLDLPGKLGWSPSFACLIFARFLEVLSRVVAYSVLQISLRGYPLLRFTGLGAGAFALLAARVAFPEASWADVAAAVIAHPGQILEPQSLLKLRYSLMIHVVLVAAAGGAQLLLRVTTAPTACKALPDMLLIAWLVVSLVSWAALGLLSWRGHSVDQPSFAALASGGKEPVIAYSSLLAAFPSSDGQVPKAVLAALQGNFEVDLTSDAAARGLTQQGLDRILASGADVLFHSHVLESLGFFSEEAVVDLLAASQPTTLHLLGFLKVPAASWERLGAGLARHGERLRKANLYSCFRWGFHSNSGAGSRALLAGLARCRNLKELVMDFCDEVPATAWAELRAAEWPELRKASFRWCFPSSRSGGGEGSQDLLSALGRSKQLEAVNFDLCDAIPDAAWKLLADGAWPRLRLATGVPEEHRERLRGASLDIEAAGEVASSTELQEHGAKQVPMHPAFVTSVLMPDAALEVQQDGNLLPALAHCPGVEELILNWCEDIPAAVWEKLGGQGEAFQQLRKASFRGCFRDNSKGAEGAGGLLSALSRCQHLQDLDMRGCVGIPAAAWQQLVADAKWPKLACVNLDWCFGSESKGIEAAAGLLAFLGRCPELKELSFYDCNQIWAAAWQQLEKATWQKLAKVNFDGCFGEDSRGADCAAGLLAALARCPDLKDQEIYGLSDEHLEELRRLRQGA
ncbi:unnamed protein product [Symbiodinium sp. CCMP2592]|nr:unnamed protein product [Symbiodinium sp. CCMP2592]